ncbi:MAG: hypothetical protein ACRDZ4_02620 [Egibacteraceae bacterium]
MDEDVAAPVGIAAGPDGALLVADTLNHKVKRLDPATGEVRTLLGDGTPFDAPLAHAIDRRRPTLPADARAAAFCREPEALAWDGRTPLPRRHRQPPDRRGGSDSRGLAW